MIFISFSIFLFFYLFVIISMVLNMKIDKFIVMESGNTYSFSSLEDLVKSFLGDDYYELSDSDKKKRLELKAYANMLGMNSDISDYVLFDEKAFIYSLLINTNIILFEKVGVNVFVDDVINDKKAGNYIVVNKYAKEMLKKLGDNYESN